MLRRGVLLFSFLLLACDGKDISDRDGAGLDKFLPPTPPPSGEAQSVWAGAIVNGNELVDGPAARGRVGDFYLRNTRGRYVIQAATRTVGVVPPGGNLVDAVPVGPDGGDFAGDQFGELSLNYQLGRTCNHDSVEVVQDGSEGGAAVLRARGAAVANDYVNIRGIGLLPLSADLIPDFPDGMECATTYILHPDRDHLEVYWTLYNPGGETIAGPLGMINETGGENGVWNREIGFASKASISDVLDSTRNAPTPYVVYQAPGVAYGIVPVHEDATTPNSSIFILGVSLIAFGAELFTDILDDDLNTFFTLAPKDGLTQRLDFVVAADSNDVDRHYRRLIGEEVYPVDGTVAWASGSEVAEARVGIFHDADGDGEVGADDPVLSYIDAMDDGSFSGMLPAGDYLLRAEVFGQARAPGMEVTVSSSGVSGIELELEQPVTYHYRIVDPDNADALTPARIMVVGDSPTAPDRRTFDHNDSEDYVVQLITAIRGTSTDVGDGADPPIVLPPGQDYRVYVMRGTEWSVTEMMLSPTVGEEPAELELPIRRVIDTTGYLSSEYHVHQVGSPDSIVPNEDRVRAAVADGIEFFCSSDHDFVSDLQPFIKMLGVDGEVRAIPGIETSPMVFGHFNAWPIERDISDPTNGAIDWPGGMDGFAMVPAEMYEDMRRRGAELIQVNHPRRGAVGPDDLTRHFDRMGLTFDYDTGAIGEDVSKMPVPPEWLRLPPDVPLFDLSFNALEVWNGFGMTDTNDDGWREIGMLDGVVRSWFNFLSFGKFLTPIGSSDTHTVVVDPMGMPRTYVRVSDDSPSALASGAATAAVLDTLAGRNDTPVDVVLTNGPHLMLEVEGDDQPLGKVFEPSGEDVTITVNAVAPSWAQIDTIEVFVNTTPDESDDDLTALEPLVCYTARTDLDPADTCGLAPLGGSLTVMEMPIGGEEFRYQTAVSFNLAASDIVMRDGARSDDAWIVVRVSGQRSIFPLLDDGVLTADTVEAFVSGDEADREEAIAGRGVPAAALSAPFYVDFDGSGYRAPFAPQ